MTEVTRILDKIEAGDSLAADELFPAVYSQLRRLAARKMSREKPGQTLGVTDLVHDAWLRLVGPVHERRWQSRAHFFAAAAEAMRRILIDRARRRKARKRGGQLVRLDLDDVAVASSPSEDLIALDEALGELEGRDPQAAAIVKLRYFAGMSHQEAAEVVGVGRRTADRLWVLARAWLYKHIGQQS
jgi:RNA polymerase sigma factor (TIGR02999 family)